MKGDCRSIGLPACLVLLLVISTFTPLASAGEEPSEEVNAEYVPRGELTTSLADFVPSQGKPYILFEEDQPIYSATGYLKQAWWEAGSPGALQENMKTTSARSSARACDRHIEGETTTVPGYGGGTVGVTVERASSSVAFMVQDGFTLSSTVLSNWVSDWDNTIYPILTTYFGKDYGSGVPEPPDVDGNCQIQVAIISMDGAYNTGGYFAPGLAQYREIVFVDHADASLGWSKVILAHEFQHLLHNAADSQENLWIDEGAADMAAYLCFGASSTLTGHSNAWTQDSGISIRWWNQRISDYGGGFLFLLWLADHLGGGTAIRQLVANTQTGGAGIASLAQSPPNSGGRILGTTFEEVFANFTIAATLDASTGIHGLSNIAMTDLCSGSAFCKIQPAGTNTDWSTPWESKGHTIEGWGVKVFKLEPGTSPPAPLTIRLSTDVSGMQGRLLSRASADGIYTISKLDFNNMVATAMVPGFGNVTNQIQIITWYGSTIGDCDYTSCGATYPSGTIDIEAARITEPANLILGTPTLADRDADNYNDTLALPFSVTSNAFFEDLNIEVTVSDSNGTIVDQMTTSIEAGGGVPAPGEIYWTPPRTDDYQLSLVMKDLLGDIIDSPPPSNVLTVYNMRPLANASLGSNATLTWAPIQFAGAGIDYWGLSDDVNTLPYGDEPSAYLWEFGDGNFSTLKSPFRGYRDEGIYIINLTVQDQGGAWSLPYPNIVAIADILTPIIKIHDGTGSEVTSQITVYTNQHIQFSTLQTIDNVPLEHIEFNWDWGDGESEGGIGHTVVSHEWTEGDNGAGGPHQVQVTAFDGKNTGYFNFTAYVKNRLPRLIFDEVLVVDTFTSLPMPDLYVDDDGTLVSIDWQFPGGVALNDQTVDRNSDFSQTSSNDWQPSAAWNTPGNKTITASVLDDDGGQSGVTLSVLVKNQWPVANIESRDDGSVVIDFRQEDGRVNIIYTFDGRDSFDPDGSVEDSSILSFSWLFDDGTTSIKSQISHSFETPGQHSVTLVVTDEYGQKSANRTLNIQVRNPLPEIEVQILEAWSGGKIVTRDTPRPEGFTADNLSRTFDEADRSYASQGTLLYFDSSGTRDGDDSFANTLTPFDRNNSDWNGLTEYTWDFGDGSPHSKESHPWHSYDIAGTYSVTLTVRDAFETGDTMSATFTVIIDEAPVIGGIMEGTETVKNELSIFHVNASDAEMNRNFDIYRDDDVNDGSNNDHDVVIPRNLRIHWDLDETLDEDGDGDPANDWVLSSDGGESSTRITHIYDRSGEVTITVRVCDGMGVCVQKSALITVNEEAEKTPTLSDFNWQDAKGWLSDTGGESAFMMGLIIVILILGWLVMRAPIGVDEDEAAEAAEAYDVQNVESDGGVLGMDQHEPPPKPNILSKEKRRSNSSGYVRPVRARKR